MRAISRMDASFADADRALSPMLYDSTKTLLQGIIRSLESTAKIGSDDQMELVRDCLYEMHQMARPLYQAYRKDNSNKGPAFIPISERASRAIPHVKLMVRAIRQKDQAAALESGKAALAEM